MKITRDDLVRRLSAHTSSRLVCFCGDPRGLVLLRFKGRGSVLQLEFSEQIYRTEEGRLIVEHIGGEAEDPKEISFSVKTYLTLLEGGENLPMQFGGSEDALSFAGISSLDAEWVSIDFEQRISRRENGALVVEETCNGEEIREVFPVSETVDLDAPGGMRDKVRKLMERDRPPESNA